MKMGTTPLIPLLLLLSSCLDYGHLPESPGVTVDPNQPRIQRHVLRIVEKKERVQISDLKLLHQLCILYLQSSFT